MTTDSNTTDLRAAGVRHRGQERGRSTLVGGEVVFCTPLYLDEGALVFAERGALQRQRYRGPNTTTLALEPHPTRAPHRVVVCIEVDPMTVQRSQGQPRPMVAPLDELPEPQAAVAVPLARRCNGTVADSASARVLGARGGAAKASRARLLSASGLSELAADAAFGPYRTAGDAFVKEHLAALAAQAGGEVGPGPSSIVASAGVQLAASRFLSDRGMREGDAKLLQQASTLANDSRQNLLAAYELAVREAKARTANAPPGDAAKRMRARLLGGAS